MNIYTISMKSSFQRREFHENQANDFNININYFDAIDGTDLSDELFESLRYTYLRPLSKGEVGCFLSHKALWEKCLLLNEPIIILEDDVIISSEFVDVTSQLGGLLDIDRVNLEGYNPQTKTFGKKYLRIPGFSLTELYQERAGAAAYILWPSGALKLLNYYEKKASLADVALKNRFLVTYQLEPVIAVQALVCEHYNIPHLLPSSKSTLNETGKYNNYNYYWSTILRFKRIANEIRKGFMSVKYMFSTKRAVLVDSNKFNIKSKNSVVCRGEPQ